MSTADGKQILYLSPRFEEVWGQPVQEMYRRPDCWLHLLHPEDRQRVLAAMEELHQGRPYHITYRIVRHDGATRWIEARGFHIFDEMGTRHRIAGVARDVTAEKKSELAVERAKTAAEAASRAKSEFLANMSHE